MKVNIYTVNIRLSVVSTILPIIDNLDSNYSYKYITIQIQHEAGLTLILHLPEGSETFFIKFLVALVANFLCTDIFIFFLLAVE